MNPQANQSSDSQQAQVADAVAELRQNLATAQKHLDTKLQLIKKNALIQMENDTDISRDKLLGELDSQIQQS